MSILILGDRLFQSLYSYVFLRQMDEILWKQNGDWCAIFYLRTAENLFCGWTNFAKSLGIQKGIERCVKRNQEYKACKELHSIPRYRSRLPVVKIDIKKRPATNKKGYEYKKSVEGWLLKSSYDISVGRLLRLLMLISKLMMSNNEVDIKTNAEFYNYYYTNFHGHKSPKGFHLPEINWHQKSLKQTNTC